MNDFLQQLRSGGKRFDRSRKPYDGSPYRGNERNGNRERKSNTHRKGYDQNQLQGIKKSMDAIAEGQKTLSDYAQRQIETMERIAEALEAISAHLHVARTGDGARTVAEEPPAAPPEIAAPSCPPVSDGGPDAREAVAGIIRGLRENGEGFDDIALHLKTRGIPTLSGRGEWRAQVVSRIYNQTAKAQA